METSVNPGLDRYLRNRMAGPYYLGVDFGQNNNSEIPVQNVEDYYTSVLDTNGAYDTNGKEFSMNN